MTQTKAELLQTRHQGDIRLGDANSSHYVGFKAPATVGTSLVWTLPAADGTAGYYLKTDGSGNLGWSLDNSGVSLSGSTNNTVATVTGANALQGEAALTFDGNILQISHATPQFKSVDTDGTNDYSTFQNSSGQSVYNAVDNNAHGKHLFQTAGTERMRIDSSGRLLLGTTSSTSPIGWNNKLQVAGTDAQAGISIRRDQASTGGALLVFGKSRGSLNGNTVVQSGDQLGGMYFTGADGTDLNSIAAQISVEVDGTPGSNDMPGRLLFKTTADGASSATERMRIDSSGRCIVGGGTHAGGSALVVKGGNQNTYSTAGFFSNHTNPTSGTDLAQLRFGSNATGVGATIDFVADANWGTNDFPTKILFKTCPDGSNSRTTALTIDSSQRVLIGLNASAANASIDDLQVGNPNSSTQTGITIGSNDEGAIAFGNNGDARAGSITYNMGSDSMIFKTDGQNTALTIDNSQNATFASAIYGPVKTVSALQLDLSTGNYFIKTISGNSTFTFANPAASGQVTAFTLELTHSSGTVTWPSSVKWNSDTAPTLTTGKTHLFMFVTDDGGSRYRGSALVDYVN